MGREEFKKLCDVCSLEQNGRHAKTNTPRTSGSSLGLSCAKRGIAVQRQEKSRNSGKNKTPYKTRYGERERT